ncbi:helix-hairpin-helix domain-containing protein [Pleionea sp. CnH1-48]|uniref:ComEA family DNA-binding protein n=1 Tax=Pleionea sp. CnH1-48 TaxID=2954494 RepID=UPI002097A7ED|nr:helix-hairpin-helix domain-containing protein [Pleionea sp. CnH1-48]MCO7223819.1 helix-hairpin-helix domain-containing protein [Pleionea sp. CnH1-48]
MKVVKSLAVAALVSLFSWNVSVSAETKESPEPAAKLEQAQEVLVEKSNSPLKQGANLNLDTAERLAAMLKGVGMVKAKAIVAYREQVGEFKSVEQLLEVPGIGQKILDSNLSIIKI